MTRSGYVVEIETCVGIERGAMSLLLEAPGAETVGCSYPLGGRYETRALPPGPDHVLPHLPAILTTTASGLITLDYVARIAGWFRHRRKEHPGIPNTRLRIRRQQGDQALVDIDLETEDPALAIQVAAQIVNANLGNQERGEAAGEAPGGQRSE